MSPCAVACASVLLLSLPRPVSACIPPSDILPAYNLSRHHSHSSSLLPADGHHRTRPGRTLVCLDSTLPNYQAVLRHRNRRPVASIATSATRHPAKTARTYGFPSACANCFASAAGTGLCIILEGLCWTLRRRRIDLAPPTTRYRHRHTVARDRPECVLD